MARPRRRNPDPLVRDLEFIRVEGWEPPERLLGLEVLWDLPGVAEEARRDLPIRSRVEKLRDLLVAFVDALSDEEQLHPPALKRSDAHAANILLRLPDEYMLAEEKLVKDLYEAIAQTLAATNVERRLDAYIGEWFQDPP